MRAVLFPLGFLDLPDIENLSPELKLMAAGLSVHPQLSPCGVITLTDFTLVLLGILPSVGKQYAAELARRRVAAFDEETREFFLVRHFNWHRTGNEVGVKTPWAKAIDASLARVVSEKIKELVAAQLSSAPAAKLASVAVPTNLLSSLPAPGGGKKWGPTDLLVMLAVFANPAQTDAGGFVVDFDAMGALCSLPPQTVVESLTTFDAAKALIFDRETREVFLPARMKISHKRNAKSICETADSFGSRRVKFAAKRQFLRTFGKNHKTSMTCALEDVQRDVYVKRDSGSCFPDSSPFCELTRALDALVMFARKRNRHSDILVDRQRAVAALATAEKLAVPDGIAAAAISNLLSRGGWPREAKAEIEQAKQRFDNEFSISSARENFVFDRAIEERGADAYGLRARIKLRTFAQIA